MVGTDGGSRIKGESIEVGMPGGAEPGKSCWCFSLYLRGNENPQEDVNWGMIYSDV